MEVIADTTVLIDLWRHRNRSFRLQSLNRQLGDRAILLPWITRGEFLRGVFHQNLPEEAVRPFLETFVTVWPTTQTISLYAKNWAALARSGKLIDYPDLWIAAGALERGIPLVTRNPKHFEHLPELQLESYFLDEQTK